ncbi:hypothetical protein WDU99_04100 [Microbacterium sp. Mu-80]|uniref:Dioxygenase n=1 Tax=Microbacterium bandirmense TaxID=3122050 RepID=A0ABU8L840_9MICO
MAVRGSRGARQRTRTEAERARLYTARTMWHEKQVSRRRRDTWIAVIVGGLIVIGAIVSQTMLGLATGSEPTPAPTQTTVPTEQPTPTPSPTDSTPASPTPEPTQTTGE